MNSPRCEIIFGGERLILDAAGVLYWPRMEVLVASDLHFEKSTYLAQHGAFVAPYDTLDTLERLEATLAHYKPRRLLLLGDSFHDSGAWARLDDPLRARVHALCTQVGQCHWIEGNHDRSMAAQGFGFEATLTLDGMLFSHEKEPTSLPQVIGHFHPKTGVTLGKRTARGPCFVVTERLLVMPAFGSYTGGLDIRHPAFIEAVDGAKMKPYLLYGGQIYPMAVLHPTRG